MSLGSLAIFNEIRAIGIEPILREMSSLRWCAVLLKDESIWQQTLTICHLFWKQTIHVIFSIHLRLFIHKMQLTFAIKTNTRAASVSPISGSLVNLFAIRLKLNPGSEALNRCSRQLFYIIVQSVTNIIKLCHYKVNVERSPSVNIN